MFGFWFDFTFYMMSFFVVLTVGLTVGESVCLLFTFDGGKTNESESAQASRAE